MAKISIIVPVYNSEKYLDKCIKSLLDQTLRDIEIILIDDCSTDSSKETINEYYNLYKDKIVPIYLPENQKQGVARNEGIKIAKGEYILFVDSDDYIDLNMCQLIYDKAKEGSYDIICFDINEVYENEIKSKKLTYKSDIEGEIDDEKRNIIINSPGYFTTRAYRKDMIIKNKIKFPSKIFYEDSPFNFISLLYSKTIAKIDKELYYYTQRNGSSSNSKNENRAYDRIKTVEYMFKEINEKNIYIINKKYVDTKYLKMTVGNIHLCLDMFDEPDINVMKKIATSLNKNIPNWKYLNEYKELDKVSKLYININNKSPKFLTIVDRIYKKIVQK